MNPENPENPVLNLRERIIHCRRCPRLVRFREEVARVKKRAYADWSYWGRPVASLGECGARLLVVGLAPGAHGANRTGRIFTGDGSGDLLYRTLYRFGFANRPHSVSRDDGLELIDAFITAAARCVPPANRPTAGEIAECRGFLVEELRLLRRVRVVVALGGIAWDAYLSARRSAGMAVPAPKPRFGHRSEATLDTETRLIGCYHPSRQNTQTGRLTPEMFDEAFARARALLQGG
jgi:uracil-DNA glycosylase